MPENVAREFAEKGAARARDVYGKTQAAAEETTKVMEQTTLPPQKAPRTLISISLTSFRQTRTQPLTLPAS